MLIFQDDGIRHLQSEKRNLMQTIVDKDALIQSLQMNQSISSMGQLSLTSASGEEGGQSDIIKRLKDRNNVLCEAIRQSDIKIGILERDKNQQAAQLAEALETKRLIQDAYVKTQKQHSEEIVQLRHQLRESNQHYKDTPKWQFSHQDVTLSQQELGRGAFGTVRIGKFRGQSVAVKQLYAELQSPENISRINREIDILSQLRHPNIVQFIGAILDHPDGNPRIITEVIDTIIA
ncbi:PREDICTED: probable serine/threonine-protein kinase drkD [Amphimedon queenslandica]|nr:PREDICTED: probable serine/threonine-protein kinase drkD [Amphimedon queenslandica]|eukprot:XP_019859333.1 PREDICTED: probable serine/threonine-protein kinase drkD [Amphimedon queenslandica]